MFVKFKMPKKRKTKTLDCECEKITRGTKSVAGGNCKCKIIGGKRRTHYKGIFLEEK